MVADVNKLAELVELDSLPDGLRQAIESRKEEILEELRTKGEVVIDGPNGKQYRLRAKDKTEGKSKIAAA
jgi:hypothetical protein